MSSQKEPINFIKNINTRGYSNEKFKLTRLRMEFVLDRLDRVSDPDVVLKECIQHCIDETCSESKKQDMEVDRIGVSISSNLLDYDTYVPIRKMTENTTDAILNLFLKVSQSKGRDGSLLGEPFTVTVTGVRTVDLPKSRQIIGNGPIRTNFLNRKIDDNCLIKINNRDKYCLFYALEIMRIHSSKEMTRHQFYTFKNNMNRQSQGVMRLLKKTNIARDAGSYDAKKCCPIIQKYYDEIYGPGKFKIFIFSNYSFKPIYTSNVDEYLYPILLFHHDHHFDGIRTLSKFFKSRNYCLSCESPYNRNHDHNLKCRSRCINCSGVGPIFPCQAHPTYKRRCSSCNKLFQNPNCFNRHLKNNFCNKSKQCTKCGRIWSRHTHPLGHSVQKNFVICVLNTMDLVHVTFNNIHQRK